MFLIYGVVFALLVLLGSAVMVNPPEGYRPAGWTPPESHAGNHHGTIDFSASEMLHSR